MPSVGDGENKSASFQIGSGGPRVYLSTDNGDLHIKKGSGFAPVPPEPPSPDAAPAAPKAPHLKAPKSAPPEPVTQ
jgi:hypothetical protein